MAKKKEPSPQPVKLADAPEVAKALSQAKYDRLWAFATRIDDMLPYTDFDSLGLRECPDAKDVSEAAVKLERWVRIVCMVMTSEERKSVIYDGSVRLARQLADWCEDTLPSGWDTDNKFLVDVADKWQRQGVSFTLIDVLAAMALPPKDLTYDHTAWPVVIGVTLIELFADHDTPNVFVSGTSHATLFELGRRMFREALSVDTRTKGNTDGK